MGHALSCFDSCLGPHSPRHRYGIAHAPGALHSGALGALLEEGSRVIVRNLQTASQHNGKEGVVLSFEPVASRYLVSLPVDGTSVSVRPENLLPSIGVCVVDVQSRGDLNGRVGRVVGADAERYHVSVQGQVVSLGPANVQLPKGARVRIEGLKQTPHYNGAVGIVLESDREAKRYVVLLEDEHRLSVRWESVRL